MSCQRLASTEMLCVTCNYPPPESTSGPPKLVILVILPSLGNPHLPCFANEEKMRLGRLKAEAPLGLLGETHVEINIANDNAYRIQFDLGKGEANGWGVTNICIDLYT